MQYKNKFDVKKTLQISLAFAWISVLANIMDTATPLILVNQFDFSYTKKGIIMAIDNIVGLFILPVFGVLSDRCRSKWGKRTPYILAGSLLAIVFWALCGVALMMDNATLYIVFLCCGLTSIATARPASLSLLPDVTCMRERRRANAITQIVSIVFTLIGVGLCSLVFDGVYYIPYFVGAAIMLVLWILFVKKVNEPKLVDEFAQAYPKEVGRKLTDEEERSLELDIDLDEVVGCTLYGMTGETMDCDEGEVVYQRVIKRSKRGRAKFFLLACIFFFYMSFNGLVSSLSNYATEVLNLKGNTFVLPQLFCMIAACIVAVPASKLTKKLGRKNSLMLGLVLMLLAFLIASKQSGLTPVMLIAFVVAGIGYSITLVNFYPYYLELNAKDSIGTATGTFNNAMMLAMIVTPILTGILSDQIFIGVLFPYCSAALAFSLAALFLVPQHINYNE